MNDDIIINAAKEYEKSTAFGDIVLKAKGVNSAAGIGFLEGAKWANTHILKDAQGEDLPEIDREVIVLVSLEGFFEIPPDEPVKLSYKVVFAHRPPKHWDGKNILTGEVTRYTPETYDKGEWNIPNVKWWLDLELPKMEDNETE